MGCGKSKNTGQGNWLFIIFFFFTLKICFSYFACTSSNNFKCSCCLLVITRFLLLFYSVLHQNIVIRKKSKDKKNGVFEKEMPSVDKEESVAKEHDAEEPMPEKEKLIAMENSYSDDELFFSAGEEEPEFEPEDEDPTL